MELVNWAAHELNGSNGVIGLTGCSYLGINQLFTAAALGPHSPVKAILPACASNSYEIYFAGGIPGPTIGLFGEPSPLSGTKHEPENTAAGSALEKEILAHSPTASHASGRCLPDRSLSSAAVQRQCSPGIDQPPARRRKRHHTHQQWPDRAAGVGLAIC